MFIVCSLYVCLNNIPYSLCIYILCSDVNHGGYRPPNTNIEAYGVSFYASLICVHNNQKQFFYSSMAVKYQPDKNINRTVK